MATHALRKWIREGRLPAFRLGRALRVKVADARAFESPTKVSCETLQSLTERCE